MADDALFHRDGARFVPTILSQGPWDPHALHGGPVSALFAVAIEATPAPAPLHIARMTIDITRPVPLEPLDVRVEVIREGKKVQLLDVAIEHAGVIVSRCRALRMRHADTSEMSNHPQRPDTSPPALGPADGTPLFDRTRAQTVSGFVRSIDASRVVGGFNQGAPAVTWYKLNVPVIAGEPTSPIARLCSLADFTSGNANYIDFLRYTSINADLTIHVVREPETDWIAVDSHTVIGGDGTGQSRAVLFDEHGLVGNAAASLVVDLRPAPFVLPQEG